MKLDDNRLNTWIKSNAESGIATVNKSDKWYHYVQSNKSRLARVLDVDIIYHQHLGGYYEIILH